MQIISNEKMLNYPPDAGVPAPRMTLPVTGAANGLSLEDVWRRLVRQKWTLLLIALTVMLLTAYFTWTTPPSYRAGATVQIEKEGAQVVNFGTVSTTSPDMGEQDPFFRTQYEQLKSRKLAETVMAELNLQQRLFGKAPKPNPLKAFLKSLLPTRDEGNNAAKPVDYVAVFAKNLYVEPIEKTHLVKVFYESPDPVLSAEIVNALVNAFIKENINSQSETDSYAKAFLEQEMEKARTRLTMQEAKLVEYAKQNNILDVNNGGSEQSAQSSESKKLDDLYLALGAAERNRIQAESLMIQGNRTGNVREVLNNPVITGIKQNLVTLEAQYQEKLKLFKPAYPEMQSLQQQIQETRSQLQNEVGGLKQSLQADYAAAKKLEDGVRAELDAFKGELVNLRDRSIEYNALKREVETSRNLYDGLLQRMKEVNVAANVTSSNIKIVDIAVPSDDIFRPKRTLNLIIGSLVGLMLGAGIALLRETLGQTVASVSELQALSGLPVLGTIPRVRNLAKNKLAIAVIHDVGSSLAEAYRVATANLRFILPGGAPRVTLITSVNPGEGKSTSAVNIAVSQAQQGFKVLLIDADLRKPSLHTKMGVDNYKGLSNFLGGEVDIGTVTLPVRDVKGLYLVTAGTLNADPVRMVSSPAMAQLLALAPRHFDSVIIDAPPVAGFADAIYLSAMAQATLIVTDEDNINRKRLLNTIEQLRRAKRNVVGFLMVKSQDRTFDYRYPNRYQARIPVSERPKQVKGKRGGLNLAPVSS
ncbi:MAG: polysaccharide biosynthesis tyrosine autokinase [Thiothrix sp.]|uniref:GumC family protein n=1 Tax=Thiothrix sp. TaxID=1032 RepID=UPI00261D59F7|nr:polysaccharide biosynthesis tyrosine autokinase [Thiothrix sp.]MDD5394551.1 polysaccharide biosynthesis tyrosine autokinase [Thiothrix sp.]